MAYHNGPYEMEPCILDHVYWTMYTGLCILDYGVLTPSVMSQLIIEMKTAKLTFGAFIEFVIVLLFRDKTLNNPELYSKQHSRYKTQLLEL